jgi:hypothetical protein
VEEKGGLSRVCTVMWQLRATERERFAKVPWAEVVPWNDVVPCWKGSCRSKRDYLVPRSS